MAKGGPYCNADKGGGVPCHLPAGWGTEHIGRGPCRKHLGNVPNVIKHHARAEALAWVHGQMGAEIDVDLLQAPMMAVRLALGTREAWRVRIAAADEVTPAMDEGLRQANIDFAQLASLALKAGVAERQIVVVERLGEQLSLVFEEAVASVQLDTATRQALVLAYVAGVKGLEDVESTAEED